MGRLEPHLMNVLNAIAFAAFGSLMELLPRVFPSWFPPTHSDQASCRALWLDLMGAVQMTLGLGFILRTQVLPALYRALVILPAAGRENLALPNPRGVGTR
jgi:hypothetical protein